MAIHVKGKTDNNMKKTYFAPEIDCIEIKATAQLLAGSNIPVNATDDPVDAGNAAAPELDIFKLIMQ